MLMTSPRSDHVLQVTDLIDRPGASRQVDLALPVPEEFELPLASVTEPLALDAVVESVVDGMLVRGVLTAEVTLACARCLKPIPGDSNVDVVELFPDPAALEDGDEADEGYELRDGVIDVRALLRDGLASVIPYRPLCRPDCAGLCERCGRDLNEGDCGCADEEIDPRWEALRGLQLPGSDRVDGGD